MINEIFKTNDVCFLVGMNSQGKSTILSDFKKNNNDKSIFISNEVKASEYIKNSASNSPLIQWLEKLLVIGDIQTKINEQLKTINLSDINNVSNIKISLESSADDYKGLVNVNINTTSNQWEKPGSGETFLAELLLVEKMLSPNIKNPIKYLIIDEPETFLHPSLFLKVTEILKRIAKYTKILIATHSPKFLEYAVENLGSIIYVKDGNMKRIPSDEDSINFFSNLPFYNDVLNYKDDELETTKACFRDIRKLSDSFVGYFNIFLKPKIIQSLFASLIVIGEGRAEKVLFDCLKKEKHTLQLSNVEFIDLYGKDFMLFFGKLMEFIGIKVVLIFDQDTNHCDEFNLRINKELLKFKNISFEKDIEHFLEIENKDKSRNYKSAISPMFIYQLYFQKDKKILELFDEIEKKIIEY